jgi:hypothetical protein
MEKTISYLNSKAWYRLMKVIYLFIFAASTVISVVIVYGNNTTNKIDDYLVVCNYGNRISYYARKDKNIYFDEYDLRENKASFANYQNLDIRQACGITNEEAQAWVREIVQGSSSATLYTITKTQIFEGGVANAASYSLLDILIITLIFEIFRRIFYYIVLGKIAPRK